MAYPNRGYHNNGGSFNHDRNPSPPPFASTPIVNRSRPRFASSGPPNYPRPGSSASKPNPTRSFSELMRSRYSPSDTMSDSMMNNCGDSMQYVDTTFPNDSVPFPSDYNSSDSYQSQDSSLYYSCNESFGASPRKTFPLLGRPLEPMDHPHHFQPPQQAPTDRPFRFQEPQRAPSNGPLDIQSSSFSNPKHPYKAASSVIDSQQKKPTPYFKRPKLPLRKSDWRCDLCDKDFTSRQPYTMHYQGAKHAKKLKMQESLQAIQSQVNGKEIVKIGTTFICDICSVIANSTFQLQTHLEGVKHKNKLAQMEMEKEEESKAEDGKDPKVNGANKKEAPSEKKAVFSVLSSTVPPPSKSSIVHPPPKPSVAPPPPKPTFICTICNVTLNSKLQYDQHMDGKYHKSKATGKTLPYKKKFLERKVFIMSSETLNPAAEVHTTEAMGETKTPEVAMPAVAVPVTNSIVGIPPKKVIAPSEPEPSSAVAPKDAESAVPAQTVVGVKPLASSFVSGETLK